MTAPIHLYVHGSTGKMGKTLLEAAAEDPCFCMTDQISENTDVIIDFSSPDAIEQLLEKALIFHIPLVIGTTGILEPIRQKIKKASSDIPILCSPNFSLGIALFNLLLSSLGDLSLPPASYYMEETHCNTKKDLPSGTALSLAKALQKEVKIKSYRVEDTVFQHTLKIIFEEETFEIKHQAFSRKVFAKGALNAAKWMMQQSAGLYDLSDLFKIKNLIST